MKNSVAYCLTREAADEIISGVKKQDNWSDVVFEVVPKTISGGELFSVEVQTEDTELIDEIRKFIYATFL